MSFFNSLPGDTVASDPRLWLLCLAVFFLNSSSSTYFIIYKDFLDEVSFTEFSAVGLSILGAGDVAGRLLTAVISSFKVPNNITESM